MLPGASFEGVSGGRAWRGDPGPREQATAPGNRSPRDSYTGLGGRGGSRARRLCIVSSSMSQHLPTSAPGLHLASHHVAYHEHGMALGWLLCEVAPYASTTLIRPGGGSIS